MMIHYQHSLHHHRRESLRSRRAKKKKSLCASPWSRPHQLTTNASSRWTSSSKKQKVHQHLQYRERISLNVVLVVVWGSRVSGESLRSRLRRSSLRSRRPKKSAKKNSLGPILRSRPHQVLQKQQLHQHLQYRERVSLDVVLMIVWITRLSRESLRSRRTKKKTTFCPGPWSGPRRLLQKQQLQQHLQYKEWTPFTTSPTIVPESRASKESLRPIRTKTNRLCPSLRGRPHQLLQKQQLHQHSFECRKFQLVVLSHLQIKPKSN